MDTVQLQPPPPRTRWFAGLRRSRARALGGVAGGFAEFWQIDPLVPRVVLAAPLGAAVLALASLPWLELVLGISTVPMVQGLWLVSALTACCYAVAWVLIPSPDGPSLARRFFAVQGPLGVLVKAIAVVVGLVVLSWLALAVLIVVANGVDSAVGTPLVVLGVLAGLLALVLGVVWLSRGGDVRDALHRLGSPGFGRGAGPTYEGWAPPESDGTDPIDPIDPIDPAQSADATPTAALDLDATDSVHRAKAAATAAADARAAEQAAARRVRSEQARARRAAARAERRERNRWGKLVAAMTLIVAGVLLVTDQLGRTSLGPAGIGVVCLGLLAVGVVVGAWFGSARWLIVPAIVLALAVAAGTAVTTMRDFAATNQPTVVTPKELAKGTDTVMHWDEGRITIDLTRVKQLAGRSLTASVDRGSLEVILPDDQWTMVDSLVMVGANNLGGAYGLHASAFREFGSQASDDEVPLMVTLHVGVGMTDAVVKES